MEQEAEQKGAGGSAHESDKDTSISTREISILNTKLNGKRH